MNRLKENIAANSDIGNEIFNLIERLYPICRSITGNGVRETFSIISEVIPLNVSEIPSGTNAFDWVIPNEWNIQDAWIKDSKGDKIVDFNKSNLHILNYSIPVNKKVQLNELKKHLHTIPEYPDWIPYRTSYYNKNWGFCISHDQYMKLENETYEVNIESTLEPGSLTYAEYYLKGKTSDEILISCHTCHPSLCNDNLSGIAIATYLAKELSNKELDYSYRFLFVPATIGPIAWLSQNEEKVKNIKYGLVLSLLGNNGQFTYKKSRQDNAEIDVIVVNQLGFSKTPFRVLDFSPYGYDERQYCSPGFNLPVGNISRAMYGEFPEYHTSADNLEFIEESKLTESLGLIYSIIYTIENNKYFINLNPKCEPNLGKRGLFNKIGGKSNTVDYQMAILWILNYSDGKNSLVDISNKSGYDFNLISEASKSLFEVNLLKQLTNPIRN